MSSPSSSTSNAVSLPKGGGAITSIGEKFQPNLFTGTGNFSFPIFSSPGREGFGPSLSLNYSSGNGNGIFGLGWNLSIPSITRKTDKGIPKYSPELTDTFILSGAEDLVMCIENNNPVVIRARDGYEIILYRPRTEGLFAKIERWIKRNANGSIADFHWRAVTKENITNIYGRTVGSRITNNENDPYKTFEWLLEETFDAKGNHILYEYAKDKSGLVSGKAYENNRAYHQKYIRRIYYGNVNNNIHALTYSDGTAVGVKRIQMGTDHNGDQTGKLDRTYMMELLFDYGDCDLTYSLPVSSNANQETLPDDKVRTDPYSTFRSSFEVRTMRRCSRVLMYHHFKELDGHVLVKSTDFDYTFDEHSGISLLTKALVKGYKKEQNNTIVPVELPPLKFTYSQFQPQSQRFQSVNSPIGYLPEKSLRNDDYAMVDLFGDGLPDIINSTYNGLRYWKNTGNGNFDLPRFLESMPAGVKISKPTATFGDMDGDGLSELMIHTDSISGFFESAPAGQWKNFVKYDSQPTFNLADPNLKQIDLTGDGRPDYLLSTDEHFIVFENNGRHGFKPPLLIKRVKNFNDFPDVFFNDPSGRIKLADMNGDGLQDIVYINNRRIDYWANLGYGKFSKRYTLSTFEDLPFSDQNFDPKRLFLTDINGTGSADVVYVDYNKIYFWFNQNGNSLSKQQVILGTPFVTDVTSIEFADFFGTGTNVLVFSYDFNEYPNSNYKVLDFCGGKKPYLLNEMDNGSGCTTRIDYASSVKHFLDDEKTDLKWATHLPFPVHVVDKVETIDHINKTKLTTKYKYHHGFYDGQQEREFRGFGRVDQFDTEDFALFSVPGLHDENDSFSNADHKFHVPTVETRNWFNTGAYIENNLLREQFTREFYKGDSSEFRLGNDVVHIGSVPREAYRALRGTLIRSEVYSNDGSELQSHPYSVTESTYEVKLLQDSFQNSHAVFFTTQRETLTYNYDRNPLDPRIHHKFVLDTDNRGNILKSAEAAYPRRIQVYEEQSRFKILYSEFDYCAPIGPDKTFYRDGVVCESRSYELSGFTFNGLQKLEVAQLQGSIDTGKLNPFQFYEMPPSGVEALRLLKRERMYFYKDDLSGSDILGKTGRTGLPFTTKTLAFTKDQVAALYSNKISANDVIDLLKNPGAYDEENRDEWWITSGRIEFDAAKFYVPKKTFDPFGTPTEIRYDLYDFLPKYTKDFLGNETTVNQFDYRFLQPVKITDINGSIAEVKLDCVGFVAATSSYSTLEGDGSIRDLNVDLNRTEITNFVSDPYGYATALLGGATTRIIYDLECAANGQKPNWFAVITRETHQKELPSGVDTKVQLSFTYFDGFGREIQKKIQAEPDSSMQVRWVASGWQILNNKAKPVQQFEPAFTSAHEFEFDLRNGVSPLMFYDPLQRVVAILNPDKTYRKVLFTPWYLEAWDVNDTLLLNPSDDPDILPVARNYFDSLGQNWVTWYEERSAIAASQPEKEAASRTLPHANTPNRSCLDNLGREFKNIQNNGADGLFESSQVLDIEGNVLSISDPRANILFTHKYDCAGRRVIIDSKDAGLNLLIPDVAEKPIKTIDANGNKTLMIYDKLQRLIETRVTDSKDQSFLAGKIIYGETLKGTANNKNHAGKIYKLYDGSGCTTHYEFDFKGNPVRVGKHLVNSYKGNISWALKADASFDQIKADMQLENDEFYTETRFDALNRTTQTTIYLNNHEVESIYRPEYNDASLLERLHMDIYAYSAPISFIENIDYNAKGQREQIVYGNKVKTDYTYDALTFRLKGIHTTKQNGSVVQDLGYNYDPAGNITEVADAAYHSVFNHNSRVDAVNKYRYDALYRLKEATGREHEAMTACHYTQASNKQSEYISLSDQPINNGQALLNYTETYNYDPSGNLIQMRKTNTLGIVTNRIQVYAEESNRIVSSKAGCGDETNFTFTHDANGNMLAMAHLPKMIWNYANQLTETETTINNSGVNNRVYYCYNGAGQRTRKVLESNNLMIEETLYYGAMEIYRRYNNGRLVFERHTLQVVDDKNRIALIELRQTDLSNSESGTPSERIRYQLDNHLGSSVLEVDDSTAAKTISMEEYYPYGGTAFMAGDNRIEAKRKRYRYSGKEKDDETGLYYYGARYYAPWMGRWCSSDPIGLKAGINTFEFVKSNPINKVDLFGLQDVSAPITDNTAAPAPAPAAPDQPQPGPGGKPDEQHPAMFGVGTLKGLTVDNILAIKGLAEGTAILHLADASYGAYLEEGGGAKGVYAGAMELNPANWALRDFYTAWQSGQEGDYYTAGQKTAHGIMDVVLIGGLIKGVKAGVDKLKEQKNLKENKSQASPPPDLPPLPEVPKLKHGLPKEMFTEANSLIGTFEPTIRARVWEKFMEQIKQSRKSGDAYGWEYESQSLPDGGTMFNGKKYPTAVTVFDKQGNMYKGDRSNLDHFTPTGEGGFIPHYGNLELIKSAGSN